MLDTVIRRYTGDTSPDYRRAVQARLELAELYDEQERAEELLRILAAED